MTAFAGPLFIVGSPRSGTKLLRALLNRNPMIKICVPETHFIPSLSASFGGDRDPAHVDLKAVDLDAFYAAFDRTPFQVIVRSTGQPAMSRADFDRFKDAKDWSEIWTSIMRFYGDPQARPNVICGDKTPSYVLDMPLLKRIMPRARFLHIIRDPRDVALSVQHAWQHNVYRTATKWVRNLTIGRRDGALLGDDYAEVHYEDLLRDPAGTLDRICGILGLPFSADMTSLAKTSENIGSAAGKTFIDATNLDKYRTQMHPHVQKRVEEIVFEQAKDTPYTMDYATSHRPLSAASKTLVTGADGVRSVWRYVRRWGLVDGMKINIGNRVQKRRRTS